MGKEVLAMRIHYLIWSLTGGGAELSMPRVVVALRDCGHEVSVTALVPGDRRAEPLAEALGVRCRLLARGKADLLIRLPALFAALARTRPDIIVTSLTGATLVGQVVGRLLGIPVASWQHNAYLSPRNRRLLAITRRLTRHWVADSESTADYLVQQLGVPRSRITLWPLFVAVPDFPVAGVGGDEIRIGTLGRLHRQKGHDYLIDTAAELRQRDPEIAARISFVIAGAGPAGASLKRRVRDLGLANVAFVGYQDPARFLSRLSIFFQPSRWEGLCIAALEAMQAGLPVVASEVGELTRTVVPGENGYLCPPGDIETYADALIQLARDPGLRNRMGRAGRTRVLHHYSAERFQEGAVALLANFMALRSMA